MGGALKARAPTRNNSVIFIALSITKNNIVSFFSVVPAVIIFSLGQTDWHRYHYNTIKNAQLGGRLYEIWSVDSKQNKSCCHQL